MKKFLSLIIIAVMILSCFSLEVLADDSTVTISEDFQTVYVNNIPYSQTDVSMLSIKFLKLLDNVSLSGNQKSLIKEVDIWSNITESVISAKIYYVNGGQFSATYMRSDYVESFSELIRGNATEYIVDFQVPNVTSVRISKDDLLGNRSSTTLKDHKNCNFFTVYGKRSIEEFSIAMGSLLIYSGNYYYVDFAENGIILDNFALFHPNDYDQLVAHRISDSDVIKKIQQSEKELYDTDFGFMYDNEFTESVSKTSALIFFIILPIALCFLFTFFSIKWKGLYKKLFGAISILFAAELVVAIIIYILTVK